MRVISPYIIFETHINEKQILSDLERIGRVCYKSEDRITEDSSRKFISAIIKSGHESVIEHYSVSIRVICDRGVTHEIVRHRIASYSQESTRYCNYSKDKYDNQLTFIKPCFWKDNDTVDCEKYTLWENAMILAEADYLKLIELGASPQEARSILPNSLKSEIVMTMNLREWRHFIKLRASSKAHPQMQEIALMIYQSFMDKIPSVFEDIELD